MEPTYVIYQPSHPQWFEKCNMYTEQQLIDAATTGVSQPQTVGEAIEILNAHGYLAVQTSVH